MEQVGQFRILGKIGAGGMGEVYRARDEKLQRDVAIKVVPASQFADATARARLMREARSAAGLNHPNICVIHEVGESEGQAFIAMECVEGESLATRISRSPLSTSEIVRFGIQLADALAHAHDKGIVHRDLKPQNIIVTPEQRLKVLDFGLAKRFDESSDPSESTDVLVTAHGVIQGTPAYMSPEQLRGFPADARSDIWAMGVILHEMASRKRPFEGNTWPELSAAILTSHPQELSGEIPVELSTIVRRCLEKEPANRYQKAIEVRSALEILQTSVTSGRTMARPAPQKPWPFYAAGIALLLCIVAAIGYFASTSRDRAAAAAAAPHVAVQPAAPAVVHAVAVLPFSSFTKGDDEYLSDAMQDSIIGELARVKNLRVLSRTSTLPFKKGDKSATEISKILNADHLVEGSVARAGDRIRVEIKLIRTSPVEQQVWSEAYDRDLRDALSLYGEIASAVATQIDSRLAAAAQQARSQVTRQVDPEIYKLYLRGLYQLHKGGDEGFKAGIALMRQAIENDPSEPLGYAGLAQAYALRVHDGLASPDDIVLAKAAASKAASMGADTADIYAAFALLHQYGDRDWKAAEENFRKALEMNPSLAEIRRQWSWHLMSYQRGEEALEEMRRARDTEPTDSILYSDIAWHLQILGRNDEALVEARRALEMDPNNPNNVLVAGLVYLKKGMFDDAISLYRKGGAEAEPFLAYALVVAGRNAEADKIIEKLRKRDDNAWVLAEIYAAKGDKDEAFRWLDKARPAAWAPWFGIFDEFAPLRGDPRMAKFRASINMPDVNPQWPGKRG